MVTAVWKCQNGVSAQSTRAPLPAISRAFDLLCVCVRACAVTRCVGNWVSEERMGLFLFVLLFILKGRGGLMTISDVDVFSLCYICIRVCVRAR